MAGRIAATDDDPAACYNDRIADGGFHPNLLGSETPPFRAAVPVVVLGVDILNSFLYCELY